jgi:hypothetical protein
MPKRLTVLLLMLPFAALSAQQDPIPAAATLQNQFDEAQREWSKKNAEAYKQKDTEAQAQLRQSRPEAVFASKFQAGAKAYASTEQAVPYLAWLVSRGDTATSKVALTTLMDEHIESPGIRLAVARIGGLKQVYGVQQSREWLDRVLAANQDPQVRAQALFTRAAMYVGTRAVETSDALRRYAIGDLQASLGLLAQAGDEDGRSLGGLIDTLLDEAQRLEPGLPAPEIEGKDLDGVPFKLSDYRGKVVMLDFWGDW